ncbi:hypothetical protein CcaCcLH18_12365 [Colletotrichum camelliae]|nr:hypothetical protein CcaCcLH18_12365 [Colletotrichum camelliae]
MQINAYFVSLALLAVASAAGVPSKVERAAPHPVIAARNYCCSPSPQNPKVCDCEAKVIEDCGLYCL